jgi:signal peptidase I
MSRPATPPIRRSRRRWWPWAVRAVFFPVSADRLAILGRGPRVVTATAQGAAGIVGAAAILATATALPVTTPAAVAAGAVIVLATTVAARRFGLPVGPGPGGRLNRARALLTAAHGAAAAPILAGALVIAAHPVVDPVAGRWILATTAALILARLVFRQAELAAAARRGRTETDDPAAVRRRRRFAVVTLGDWAVAGLALWLVAQALGAVAIKAYRVESASMAPTFIAAPDARGILVVDRLAPQLLGLDRFDIVVFTHPGYPGDQFVKRVVATGGETLGIDNGNLFINDRIAVRPPAVQLQQMSKPLIAFDAADGAAELGKAVAEHFVGSAGELTTDRVDARGFWLTGGPGEVVSLRSSLTAPQLQALKFAPPTDDAAVQMTLRFAAPTAVAPGDEFEVAIHAKADGPGLRYVFVLSAAEGTPTLGGRIERHGPDGVEIVQTIAPLPVDARLDAPITLRVQSIDGRWDAWVNGARLPGGPTREPIVVADRLTGANLRLRAARPVLIERFQIRAPTHYVSGGAIVGRDDLRVPDGHIVVLGDNALLSHDSRRFKAWRVTDADGRTTLVGDAEKPKIWVEHDVAGLADESTDLWNDITANDTEIPPDAGDRLHAALRDRLGIAADRWARLPQRLRERIDIDDGNGTVSLRARLNDADRAALLDLAPDESARWRQVVTALADASQALPVDLERINQPAIKADDVIGTVTATLTPALRIVAVD